MSNEIYNVYTNLNPQQLSQVAAETFMTWLKFALGKEALDGKRLKHPTGRYAASLSWHKTGVNKVAIIADEKTAPEAGVLEAVTPIDLKAKMLGKGKTRIGKDGYRYRVIPLKPEFNGSLALGATSVVSMSGGQRVSRSVARMWARQAQKGSGGTRFRVMSDKPGSATWVMPTYQPAAILAELLNSEFGGH